MSERIVQGLFQKHIDPHVKLAFQFALAPKQAPISPDNRRSRLLSSSHPNPVPHLLFLKFLRPLERFLLLAGLGGCRTGPLHGMKRRKRSCPDLFRHDRGPTGHPATRQACTSAVRISPSRISGHPPFRSRYPSPPPPDPDGCGAFRRPWPRTLFPSLPGSLPGSQG